MSKRARTPDRDPNVAAFEMVRALEEATSHDDDHTDGSDKGARPARKEKPAEGKRERTKK